MLFSLYFVLEYKYEERKFSITDEMKKDFERDGFVLVR